MFDKKKDLGTAVGEDTHNYRDFLVMIWHDLKKAIERDDDDAGVEALEALVSCVQMMDEQKDAEDYQA